MDVFFGNFWRKKREPDEQPGLPVSVDKYFEYGGFTWVCPRIYLCKEVHWKSVCSALTFEPVKEVTWKCSIQVAPFAPMEIPFFAEQAKN